MPESTLETWFRAWRDRHDGDALARVFDASAAKLLLIAQHLTRDAGAAEDLVQSTFLAVLESAGRWDERQPLFPWLVGILANHARMHNRRGRALPEPSSARGRASEDPSDAASAREIDAALTAAIDALPATYRDVLVLRLVHGLAGVEIAHALSRSPQTVRTQLHRGLERLREALPKGLLAPAIVVMLAGDGLAAVRARVLAAGGKVAVPAAVAWIGVLTMKKLAVASAALAALGAWWMWETSGGESVASEPAPAGRPAGASAPASMPLRPESESAGALRVAVPAAGRSGRALLRGRCVAAGSGTALADAEICFSGYGADEEDRKQHAPRGPWRLRTDAAGAFEVRFDPPSSDRFVFVLEVRAPDRATVGARWYGWRADLELDIGDVVLPLGTKVTGRVVTQGGREVAGTSLGMVGVEDLPCGNQRGLLLSKATRTKEDGTFAFPEPFASAKLRIAVGQGYRPVGDGVVELLAGERCRDVTVVVRTPDPDAVIEGTVVDELGQPIGDVGVEACTVSARPAAEPTRTDEHGAFTLRCNGDPAEPARLRWTTRGGDGQKDAPVPWKTRGVRLVALRPPPMDGIDLVVVDARTKEPVEEYSVSGALEPAKEAGPYSRLPVNEMPARHEGGRLRIKRMSSGAQTLLVVPKDPAYAPSDVVAYDPARQGSVPLRVELEPPAQLRIRVRNGDGTPVAGTRIEAWRWLLSVKEAPWSAATVPNVMLEPSRSSSYGFALHRLAAATTDAEGLATLAVTPRLQNVLVQALGPGHLGLARGGVASGESVELVVARGATLIGGLEPAGIVRRLDTTPAPAKDPSSLAPVPLPGSRRPGIRLVELAAPGQRMRWFPAGDEPAPLADDGTFRIREIPAGTWRVYLHVFGPVTSQGASRSPRGPLTTLTLSEGERREITLDASGFVPCTVTGRVSLDGKPLGRVKLRLMRWEAGSAAVDGSCSSESIEDSAPDGAFAQKWAQAGVLRLCAIIFDTIHGQEPTCYWSEDSLSVTPGEAKDWDVRLQTRRLELRLVSAEGRPLAGWRAQVDAFDKSRSWPLETDRDGLAVLEPAPPVDLAITARAPGGTDAQDVPLGTHRVRLDARTKRLELRPSGRK